MKYIFASIPLDEEAIKLDVEKYFDDSGLCFKTMHKINDNYGVNHASVYIKEALSRCSANKSFIDEIEKSSAISKANFEVIIIPSMFYKQHPEIGGDGAVFKILAERLKIPYRMVPLKPLGSISENSKLIVQTLEECDHSKPKWLLSMSKGAADLKRAFASQLTSECRHSIHGIFNVSGAHGGTILADKRRGKRLGYFIMKNWLRLRGSGKNFLKEFSRQHSFSRSDFMLDDHIEVINLFGIPLLSHLRKPLTSSYQILSEYGPNDGYILTEDCIIPSGKNILFWGADHYLRTPELNLRVEQCLKWVNQKEGRG